jgi:hypothetical protein
MAGKSFSDARKKILNVLVDNGSITTSSPELMRTTHDITIPFYCATREICLPTIMCHVQLLSMDVMPAFGEKITSLGTFRDLNFLRAPLSANHSAAIKPT